MGGVGSGSAVLLWFYLPLYLGVVAMHIYLQSLQLSLQFHEPLQFSKDHLQNNSICNRNQVKLLFCKKVLYY